MKMQTRLKDLCLEFIKLKIDEDENEVKEFYQKIEEKWHNVQEYSNAYGEHPNYEIWEQLYLEACDLINGFILL